MAEDQLVLGRHARRHGGIGIPSRRDLTSAWCDPFLAQGGLSFCDVEPTIRPLRLEPFRLNPGDRSRHAVRARPRSAGRCQSRKALGRTMVALGRSDANRVQFSGILRSEGESRLPQVIQQADLGRKEVIRAVKQIKSHGNSPLPENPKQPFLFP